MRLRFASGVRGLLLIVAVFALTAAPAFGQDLPPEVTDPPGDTIDFAGNPAEGPDLIGVTAVEVRDYTGEAAWDLFEDLLFYEPTPDVVEVIPEQPGPLLSGTGPLVVVNARLSQPLPEARFCQIVVVFATEGLEQYSGAAGDPNNGHDTSLDIYTENGEWVTGRTEYRSGSFTFVADYNEVAAFIGDAGISVVFPRDAIPDGATWQIWVICGDNNVSAGRDFTDLGSFVPGVIPVVSVSEPETTTTTTLGPTTTTTVSPTTTTLGEEATPATVATEEPDDGVGSTTLVIVILSLVLGSGLLWFLFFRKRAGPCDCEMEKAAYDSALAAYATTESELSRARQLADDWRGRESEARNTVIELDALRPRRAEYGDDASFDTANQEYQARRADLETRADECAAELEDAVERVRAFETRAAEQWDQAQSWLAILETCWQKCFDSPFVPPAAPEPPGGGEAAGEPGSSDDGDDPRDTPPPHAADPECTAPDTQDVVERSGSFSVPADGLVRVSLSTDRGPLDDLNGIVSGNPIADMVAQLIGQDGTLELDPGALTGANARRWQDAIEEMRTLSYSVLKREIYVDLAFDVEDVAVDCVRTDECRSGRWATTGRRTIERSRTLRTIRHRWSESDSGGRPLGATMTVLNRETEAAAADARALSDFIAGCK